MSEKKVILSIDSSLACPAYAVCEVNLTDSEIKVLEVSHIKTNSKKPTGYRLFQIHGWFTDVLERYTFDEVVFEKGFNKFAIATQQIQRTLGVLLFTLYRNNIVDFHEIAPTSVKKAVTGNGKASKQQLSDTLFKYVGEFQYKTDDESDAVGVAVALALQKGWI